MGRDRYLLIMRNLHFSDNSVDSNESDRLFKIRHLIDYFNNKMNNVYYPGKELSLDNKRYKYGIKLLMLGE
ncbi:piggyBac transposable element-derived protein 4-like, partial [Aphis craccivora]